MRVGKLLSSFLGLFKFKVGISKVAQFVVF